MPHFLICRFVIFIIGIFLTSAQMDKSYFLLKKRKTEHYIQYSWFNLLSLLLDITYATNGVTNGITWSF